MGIIFPYESVCENAVFFDAIYEPMQTEFCLNAEKKRIFNSFRNRFVGSSGYMFI